MSRSDDAQLRPAWLSWLVAAIVMAIPLASVGTQTMGEPLYVAASQMVKRTAGQAGPTSKDAVKGGAASTDAQARLLAVAQSR
jgi:hypothetical protein